MRSNEDHGDLAVVQCSVVCFYSSLKRQLLLVDLETKDGRRKTKDDEGEDERSRLTGSDYLFAVTLPSVCFSMKERQRARQ